MYVTNRSDSWAHRRATFTFLRKRGCISASRTTGHSPPLLGWVLERIAVESSGFSSRTLSNLHCPTLKPPNKSVSTIKGKSCTFLDALGAR